MKQKVPEATLFFFDQILTAVHGLHRVGFAHLDIKDNNVMVTRDPHDPDIPCLKLGDFGFVKRLAKDPRWIPFVDPETGRQSWFHTKTRDVSSEDPNVPAHNPVHSFVAPE